MEKENSEDLQNLSDLQSLSRYELVHPNFLLQKYYKIMNFTDLFNEEKYNEVI